MRAIIINPTTRTITEAQIEGDSYEGIRKLVFDGKEPGLIERVSLGGHHAAYIDEEGLLTDWDQQSFFKFLGPDGGITIAGNAVLLMDKPDGDVAPTTLPIGMVWQVVEWLNPQDVRVPAPTLTTFGKDGDVKVEPLDGTTTEWSYNNQPG